MTRVAPAWLIAAACAMLAGGCAVSVQPASTLASETPAEPAIAGEPGVPAAPAAAWTAIGASVQRRPILAATVAPPAHAAVGPRVYLVMLIHGDEPEGRVHAREIVRRLAPAVRLNRATLRVVESMNPDGEAAGTRGNARGVDLNRNWPAANFRPARSHGPEPLSEPEAAAVHADLLAFMPDLLVVLHSTARGPFVNYDGPAENLAAAFSAAAGGFDTRWHVVPSMGYPTPGSLGSYMGVDAGVPSLTVEFERGQNARAAAQQAVTGLRAVLNHPRQP